MKYLLKRSLRDIKNNLTQFISIVIIIAVGSMVFSGLFATTRILRTWLDDYYATYALADQWVYVKGMSEEEILDAQRTMDDTVLEGRYRFQMEYTIGGKNTTIRFHQPTSINRLKIMEGEATIKDNIVLVDASYAAFNGLTLGDHLVFQLEEETFEFIIGGLFESPEYAYKSKDFSDAASAKQQFGIIYATHETLVMLNRHSEIYLEALVSANEGFMEAQTKLDDAKKMLDENQATLDSNRKEALDEFARQQKIIDQNRKTIDASFDQLNEAKSSTYAQLGQLKAQSDLLFQNAANLQTQYDAEYAAYLSVRDTLPLADQQTQDAYFSAMASQIQGLATQANALLYQYNISKSTADAQFAAQEAQLNQASDTLNQGQVQLNTKKKSVLGELDDAQKKLDEGTSEYLANEATFQIEKADAMREIDAIPELYFEVLVDGTDTREWLDTLETKDELVRWFDQDSYPGVTMIGNVLAPITVVSDIFPLLFFIVAAVIILISMSKNVENDRTQIAIMMAMGYQRVRILFVYLFYGWWAALIGALGFSLLGNRVIPSALISIFTIRFSLPPIPIVYYPEYVVISVLLALFFASVAILLALRHVLREIPAAAMRPKAPKSARNSFLERFPKLWNRLRYDTKLIVRNLLMGRTKLLLSSIGVVGALTLLIMGLSLRYSATNMIDQSIQSFRFQYSVRLKENIEELGELELPIESSKIEKTKTINATLADSDDTIQLNLLEIESTLLVLRSLDKKQIEMQEDTVIIPKSMQIVYGYDIGDRLDLVIDDVPIRLTITHVNTQYLGKNVYISFDHAEELKLDVSTNKIYIANASQTTNEAEISALLGDGVIRSVDTKEEMIDRSREILDMLNRIILIIILSAAVLSITVLYNLASINIFERQRELATLRVLGYTRREVQRLINTENRVLALLGTIGGVPLGILMFGWIADLVSTPDFIMSKEPNVLVLLLSVGMLLGFMETTNVLLRGKIKNIKFVESLKGVE